MPPEPSDDVLVARAASGDPRAFERLVSRYQQQMFRVAMRVTRRASDAEDAVQNAFIAAWRRLPEFRRDSAFGTWIYRITSNCALNIVRARARVDRQLDLDDVAGANQPVSSQPGPEASGEAGALLAELRAALDRLPVELRVCWYAREIDGLSYQEVADIAGVSVTVARGRIYRARQRLAGEMEAWR